MMSKIIWVSIANTVELLIIHVLGQIMRRCSIPNFSDFEMNSSKTIKVLRLITQSATITTIHHHGEQQGGLRQNLPFKIHVANAGNLNTLSKSRAWRHLERAKARVSIDKPALQKPKRATILTGHPVPKFRKTKQIKQE